MDIKIFHPELDSMFGNTRYCDLPQPLQTLALPLLAFLSAEGVLLIEGVSGSKNTDFATATVTMRAGHQRLSEFLKRRPKKISEFEETLRTLAWHSGPKFRSLSPRGTIGGQRSCNSCGAIAMSGIMICQNWQCESHKLWKLVDPEYEVPKQPENEKRHWQDMRRMGNAMRRVPGAKSVTLHNDRSITVVTKDGGKKKIRAPKKKA